MRTQIHGFFGDQEACMNQPSYSGCTIGTSLPPVDFGGRFILLLA